MGFREPFYGVLSAHSPTVTFFMGAHNDLVETTGISKSDWSLWCRCVSQCSVFGISPDKLSTSFVPELEWLLQKILGVTPVSCLHVITVHNNGKLETHEFEKKCWGRIRDVSGDKSTFQTITWIRNVTKTQTMLCSSMGPPWICFNHLQIILVLVFYHILYNDNTY